MSPLTYHVESHRAKSALGTLMRSAYRVCERCVGPPYSTKYRDRPLSKVISRRFGFVYVVNLLAASRTFLDHFVRNPPVDFGAHVVRLPFEELYTRFPECKSYVTFSVVRNPWHRMVSCYNKKVLNANNIKRIGILAQYEGLYPQMDFPSFVAWLCSEEGADENADLHWISQSCALSDEAGTFRCNHHLRLEKIETQYRRLCKRLGLPSHPLPHQAASTDQLYEPVHKSYQAYFASLSAPLLKRIGQRYEQDALRFGYPKLHSFVKEQAR